jgi:hypothetical protein
MAKLPHAGAKTRAFYLVFRRWEIVARYRDTTGQAGYRRSSKAKPRGREGAQEHHIALCLVAYLIVERERLDRGETWRQRKRQLILTGPQKASPALKRVKEAA